MSTFSFVFFNFLILVICGIIWILFFVVVIQKKQEIYSYYDTISSFCAEIHSQQHKFLLTFTVLMAMNLLCMFTEEYNSIELYNIQAGVDNSGEEISSLRKTIFGYYYKESNGEILYTQDQQDWWLFVFEVTGSLALILVGLCYTEGIQARKGYDRLSVVQIPMTMMMT